MRSIPFVLTLTASLVLLSASALAAGSFGVESVWVQTRDGAPWAEGQPVTLVVRATSNGAEFPNSALSVVMQTDGERTKCLDVAMKRVSIDGGIATYAGIFHPFRAATYDGRFGIGEDVHEIKFTVGAAPAAAAAIPANADLPVLGPVRFDYEPTLLDYARNGALGTAVLGAIGVLVHLLRRRARISRVALAA